MIAAAIRRTPETVEVRISSDLGKNVRGEISLSVFGINGEIRSQRKIAVDLAPYSAAVLQSIPLAELSPVPAEDFLYLEFQGESDGTPIRCTNECFLAKYKEYQLLQPLIRTRIFPDENGLMHLKLSADKPAFYVFAEFAGIPAVFSDNSFTLLPGQPRDLTFRTNAQLPLERLEKALVIRHLRSSYSE